MLVKWKNVHLSLLVNFEISQTKKGFEKPVLALLIIACIMLIINNLIIYEPMKINN
jgi:hypothetical protein